MIDPGRENRGGWWGRGGAWRRRRLGHAGDARLGPLRHGGHVGIDLAARDGRLAWLEDGWTSSLAGQVAHVLERERCFLLGRLDLGFCPRVALDRHDAA